MLSLEISIPNTNDNLDPIHFGKSPPFPTAKSINVLPGTDTALISKFLTNKL